MAAKERPRESENLKTFHPQSRRTNFPFPLPLFSKAWLRSSLGGAVVYSSGDVDGVK